MGCGASKEVALSVHPTTAVRSVTTPPEDATSPVAVDSTTDSPLASSKHANAPTSASTLKPAHFRSDAASKPSSAHPVDPNVRSDSGIGTRHSAGSSKSVLGAKPLLPSIPMGSSVVATNGGAGAAAAAGAIDDEAVATSLLNTRAASAKPVMAFEIPLDDAVKVRSRKPTSAAPRNRKRTQLQPMVHLSNDEIMKKLKEAEQKWEDPESAIAKDKDLDPSLLRAIVADRDHRIAMNRQRELEEKKSKLQQHDAHMREVAERKMRILAQQQQGAAGVAVAANDADDVPTLRMSWGGASGSLHATASGLPGSAHSSSGSPTRMAVGPRGVTASLVPAFAVMDR